MSYQSTGDVIALTPAEIVGNNISKRTIVIQFQDGQYPVTQAFDLMKDAADNCQAQIGQRITISWNYKSREYNGKWYSNANAWKIEVQGQAASRQAQGQPAPFDHDDEENNIPL